MEDDKILLPCPSVVNFQNSDPELENMELDSLPVLAALSLAPITRGNSLVKQVEFLGLAYAFATV